MSKCESCGTEKITDKVVQYSMERFHKLLCFDCQKSSGNVKPTGETAPHESPLQKVMEEVILDKTSRDRIIVRQNAMGNAARIIAGLAQAGKVEKAEIEVLMVRFAEMSENWVFR